MLRLMVKAKIHRARVTEANLHYVGSITIDKNLMDAAHILPYEIVQITNVSNATLWRTYALPGPAGQGDICLNGPPARLFQPGDLVIVLSQGLYTDEELEHFHPTILFVDERNQITQVVTQEPPFTQMENLGLDR